jgi:hypothetical protein
MLWGVISGLSIVMSTLGGSAAPRPAHGAEMLGSQYSVSHRETKSPATEITGAVAVPPANTAIKTRRPAAGFNTGRAAGPAATNVGGRGGPPASAGESRATHFVVKQAPAGSRLYGFDTSVGTAAPPDTLGGHPMTAFGPDPSPLMQDVTSITDPCDIEGSITFSAGMNHRHIGSGWMTWSHGYTGDVYYNNLHQDVVVSLPEVTNCAIYFYIEPDPFTPEHSFTITADDGTSATFSALGSAGAAYCGIFGAAIQSFTIHDNDSVGYAIGEFGIACFCDPVYRACCDEAGSEASCEEGVDIMDCIAAGGRWDIDVTACGDFDPPCGEYTGACCYGAVADPGYEPYECIGDYLQWECLYLSEYTNWTGGESCDDPLFLCPGTPVYCDGSGGCDEYIARVQMGDIDNSSGCDQYADYTATYALTVVPGTDYPITVTNGTAYSADVCAIWVDWNQDKTFEDSGPEWIGDAVGGGISPPYSFTLTVPPDFAPGYTRMRIRIDYANPDPDPCGTTTYGEVEDYSLLVGTCCGSCCNIQTGECGDDYMALECADLGPAWRWHYEAMCATLEPPCGDPGCCCDSPEPGEVTDPYPEFRANCDGRFISGVTGGDCVAEAFTPACGTWIPTPVLYAPTWNDNPGFRAALGTLLGSDVDYWNSYTQGTPPLSTMLEYSAVLTWVNYPYADAVGMGNTLADYVDQGGRVILGQWCKQSDQSNYLLGRIMEDPTYCPVLACSTSFGSGAYNFDGVLCPHDGPKGTVGAHEAQYLDVITTVSDTAQTDGTIGTGSYASISAVWNTTGGVWYCPGFTGTDYGAGDWVTLTANMVLCIYDQGGACCNILTGECNDGPPPLDCIGAGPEWRPHPGMLCAELVPPCGDPGACCDPSNGACIDDVLRANCLAIGHQPTSGTSCSELDPPCGDPGCCCDRPEPGVLTDPHFAFHANCQGRFVSGAFTLCGDFDESGVVDMGDYGMFLDAFGKCSGDPGYLAGADMDGDGCVTLADFQTWRNCYQFQGSDCVAEAFDPPCGEYITAGLLYAPSWSDNPTFRAELEALIGPPVDFWDAYHSGTPTVEYLSTYAAVFTWANYPYADPVGFGNNLADYVDMGGTVILGQWCRHGTQSNYLQGRIMDDPAYCPVLTISNSFCSGDYNMDGFLCAHIGTYGVVRAHGTNYLDVVSSVAPGATTDGTMDSGSCLSFDAVWNASRNVFYSPGNLGGEPSYTSGDWATLVANMVNCEPDAHGACCDRYTYIDPSDPWLGGVCVDDVTVLDCISGGGQFSYDQQCAELDPICGNPGACCDCDQCDCDETLEALCTDGQFLAGSPCDLDLCGCWNCWFGLLYAPAEPDNPFFRMAVSELLNGYPVDYFDARYSTPTLSAVWAYDVVFTWPNYAYADSVAMGDVLADYVDAGGRVILGQWCLPTATNHLAGRIMTADYCPAIASSYTTNVTYSGDGTTFPFSVPYTVATMSAQYCDVVNAVQPGAIGDGTWTSGSICIAYSPSLNVYYASGHTGLDFSSGNWAELTANMVLSYAPPGACCNIYTGECSDDMAFADCRDMGPAWQPHPGVLMCDDLVPVCSNPGACCDIYTGDCQDDMAEALCEELGRQPTGGTQCSELDPPCGDVGCCCDYPESGEPTDPHESLRANCTGRFISGLTGEDCVTEAFNPLCGLEDIWVSTFPPDPPTPYLCGHYITPFEPDPRPLYTDVSEIPTPCTIPGAIGVSPSVNHRRIGSGWISWGHGYTGDVYYTNGALSVTLTMPAATAAFRFYVEPNPFVVHTFQVLVNGSYLSDPFTADGSGGAAYVAVCGNPVETIQLTCITSPTPADFAIGEFGIACEDVEGACCDEPGQVCTEGVMTSACVAIPGYRFAPAPATCADFEPPCGQISGACCYEETCAYERPSDCGGEYVGDGVPCDPNPCLCYDAEMTAPGTWTGTTVGAGDDCALRVGQEVIIKVDIPTDGNWQFDVCASSPAWDTYMYLGTDCCQSTWSNDDGCPTVGVLSIIQVSGLTAGTYYVDVEPYSSSVTGPVTLTVANYDPSDRSTVPASPPVMKKLRPDLRNGQLQTPESNSQATNAERPRL